MRGYPIKEWKTEGGFISTYLLAHVLGWDFSRYLFMVSKMIKTLAVGIDGKYSAAALAISKHRRIIGGWLFMDEQTINHILIRHGYPPVKDIFSCLDDDVSPLDLISDCCLEDRAFLHVFHRNSVMFSDISIEILPRCQKFDRLLNNLSRNRLKCQISVKRFCRVAIKHRRIEIHTRRVDLSRIQLVMPVRTVAGVKGLF